MKKKIIYYGAFLTEQGREHLLKYLKFNNLLPVASNVILDHCTQLHCSQFEQEKDMKDALEYNVEHLKDKTIVLGIDAIGKSDKCMAFRVFFGIESANKVPHITICTYNDGKPVDSNKITDWKLLDEPIYADAYLDKR